MHIYEYKQKFKYMYIYKQGQYDQILCEKNWII